MSMVICKLPKAGLGNQLFPLMKAAVFAQINQLPLMVTGYQQLKIGPWLRGEKNKRNYTGFFLFQKPFFQALIEQLILSFNHTEIVQEPSLNNITAGKEKQYVFLTMPDWSNYFAGLKDNRSLVKEALIKLIKPAIIEKLNLMKPPCIGVHIRMGDFRKLAEGEDFSRAGAVRTPEHYFTAMISSIRKIHGSDLSVSVFTDGYKNELTFLQSINNVEFVEGNTDMLDLLLLSKSKVIITSAGSTFSYWSAFLSDAPVVMHPDHIHAPLRSNEVNERWYEGPFDDRNTLLLKNIKAIEWNADESREANLASGKML